MKQLIYSILCLGLVLAFQNCADMKSLKGKRDANALRNGEGYGGKIRRYTIADDEGKCSNGSEVVHEVNVVLETQEAFQVVENCEPVEWKKVAIADPEFNPEFDMMLPFDDFQFGFAGDFIRGDQDFLEYLDIFRATGEFPFLPPPPPFMPGDFPEGVVVRGSTTMSGQSSGQFQGGAPLPPLPQGLPPGKRPLPDFGPLPPLPQ